MQILCATDFSDRSIEAADVAAAIAKTTKLPLRLLHCAQEYVVMGDLPVVVPNDLPGREQLKNEAARLRATGIEVTEDLRFDSASYEIIAAAAEQPTLMIVVGSYGKGMAERWLIGSVAERTAEGASVPTLVVRKPEVMLAWLSSGAMLRLLCGVDFTASTDVAMAVVKTIVAMGNVEVEAAYVRPAGDPFTSQEQAVNRQRVVGERLHSLFGDVPVKVHVVRDVVGQPANEFLHTAEEQSSGLLVVGTHQRHGLRRLMAPSFSRNVLAHALTNVLCVPALVGVPDTRIPTIRRVLLATNFSDVCTDALRHAHSLLPSGGAIHLVHVCHEPTNGINPIIASEVYFDHSMATAKEKMEADAKMKALPSALLEVPGVAITSDVLTHYDIATAICEAADRFAADVICMGTKGHSRTGAALLGSTVQAVLARAHKPVFVVTPPLV